MHVATLLASVPSPTPTAPPAELVTPGPIGFAVMALLVVVVFLLVFDMLRRIRRARYRSEVNEDLDLAEAQARAATEASDVDDQDVDPHADPPRG
jgi:flagellar biosynthesis/type III secretory pathway M-ring protein FliF/YscJ